LGDLAPGLYFSRIWLYIKKLRKVFIQNKGNVFYCYGLDMAFVAMLFRKKYIYEESDIMYVDYRSSVMRRIMKKVDIIVQRHSLSTVLTSQGFVSFLYKKQPKNVFVLPNKLDKYYCDKSRPKSKCFDTNNLKFAFIGLIRHEENIRSFVDVMGEMAPKCEFHIWGDASEAIKKKIRDLCESHETVYYHGPFRNPVDLEEIYSQIDLNFVCYDAKGINEQIAEPNKLYESAYFNTPIIVSSGTYLSKVVEEKGIGFSLDCMKKESIVDFFKGLNENRLKKISENCANIKDENLIDDQETYRLILETVMKK